jgi:hypothetical protein
MADIRTTQGVMHRGVMSDRCVEEHGACFMKPNFCYVTEALRSTSQSADGTLFGHVLQETKRTRQ